MIVLDASALVDVVLDQPAADWVLEQIADGDVHAPAHQSAEVLSAVSRQVRAGELGAAEAEDAVKEASDLPQQFAVPTFDQVRRAFSLRERIRVLDGLYVALAEERGCPLITTDHRLAGARPPCEVRSPQ